MIPDPSMRVAPLFRPDRSDFLRLLDSGSSPIVDGGDDPRLIRFLASVVQCSAACRRCAGLDDGMAGRTTADGGHRPWFLALVGAEDLSVRGLLSTHRQLLGMGVRSNFRDKLSIVGVRSTEGYGFIASEYDVRAEIEWMLARASERPRPLPALMAAVLYFFLHVHPFVEGNGRMSRLLLARLCVAGGDRAQLAPVLYALARFQVEKEAFVRNLYLERIARASSLVRHVEAALAGWSDFHGRVASSLAADGDDDLFHLFEAAFAAPTIQRSACV